MTPDFWAGKRVLVTGHTGFKGAWLCAWLTQLGAEVTGVALPPESTPSLWDLLDLKGMTSHEIDITDAGALRTAMVAADPQVILHLAAQSLVRRSYRDPGETFAANVMGTLNVLNAARDCPNLQAVVCATSDKAYENIEQIWGYRETDPMGGRDPYSASKGASELVIASMRHSFFAPYAAGGHAARIDGWPEEASRALLDHLLAQATRPEFVYEHQWRQFDFVIWDNRCVLHRATGFESGKYRRDMRRTTVAGTAAAAN